MKTWYWIAAVAALGFALGALWRERAHEGWEQERKAVLARQDSVQAVADALAELAAAHHHHADSLGREAQRLDAIARRQNQQASAARMALHAYRDSVRAAGDTLIPVSRLDQAIAVVDSQQAVIGTQRDVIRTLAADTATLAAASRLTARERDTWKGAAEDLEQTLQGYRAKPRPKLLGILPAPSPTVAFLLGATVTYAVTR